jgi:serine/threonine protein kinase
VRGHAWTPSSYSRSDSHSSDLKPENILLDATGHVALCDFGLSKADLRPDELTTTFCGTTEYLAPEILLDEQGYSKIVDFWSLGVLLFEMCCGWSPFYAEDTQQMYKNICFGKIRFPKGVICEDGKQFVKGVSNLISNLSSRAYSKFIQASQPQPETPARC